MASAIDVYVANDVGGTADVDVVHGAVYSAGDSSCLLQQSC